MRFANPAALWLGLLSLPVLALHVLRPRRPPVEVSSTFLWREVARPVSVARPWQRLRPSVLLALQLLAVALLAVAVARPVRVTAAPLSPHTVFVLDASGSMLAADGDPDRLEAAKARARDLRSELPAGGVASVVVADARPRVVLSSSADRRAFDEAVGAVQATPGGADFATAFTLAESVETPGTPIGFVILSDGGLTDAQQRFLPPGARYERIGSQATNRAITRLTVEPRGSALHARVNVANTGGPAATQTLRLDVDGRTAEEVRVVLEAGEARDVEVDLPAGERVDAYLEGEDLLAADNHAVAVTERRRDLRVLWAGPDNLFLERLFTVVPGIEVERSAEARPAPGFDVAVYDRVAVPQDPGAPVLAIAPPGGVAGIEVTGEAENPAVTLVRTDDSLLDGLDLSGVAIAAAQRVEAPADEVLVGAEGAPLLLRGSRHGRPLAYLTFALAASNLPVQVAFPVLGDRLLTELAGATLPRSGLHVGQPLPVTVTAPLTVDGPGGRELSLAPGAAAPLADRVGYWTVRQDGRPDVTLAVNADPVESGLAPADALPIPERPPLPGEERPAGERSLLAWVAVAALVVVAAEAAVSRRRRGVSRGQWRAAVVARAAIALLVVGALAGFSVVREGRQVAVLFLIDASDSLGPGGRAAAVDWVARALDDQPRGARAGVALFGGDARLELTVQEQARLGAPAAQVDGSRTNLAGALRLAEAVLPSEARRRIVVVSDGRVTEGDAATEAQRLRAAGVQVDVHPVGAGGGPDVAVERVDAPARVRDGEAYTVRATIVASEAGPVRVRWERAGETVEERVVDVAAGRSVVELAQVAEGEGGLTRYQVEVGARADAVPENDTGFAAVEVEGPPRVLLVEGMAGEGATLARALRAGAVPTDVVAVADLPPVDELATYQSLVLVDVDARSLAADQVEDLGAVTRDLGRGLVVVGGDRSFALGGYLGSELEKLLPVESDVSDPERRPSVAQVLAIDASGSMGACHCAGPEGAGPNGLVGGGNRAGGGVNKTDISRAAAARTIEALSATDQVGVLAFNTEHNWIVPLQQLPAEEVVTRGLRSLSPAGGTDLTEPLLQAGEALREANASLRHIILFTDGFTSAGGLSALHEQAAALAAEGITVSVLATGETGAEQNLARVAEAGNGRFYNETDLADVPQIMAQEALLASRSLVNEGEFHPTVTSAAEAVRDLRQSPALLGYIGATAKPTAQVHLRVGPEEDPLLASWQVGLGRVTTWTSDASARWSQQWAAWDGYAAFWSAVVKDTFPLGGADGSVRAQIAGGRMEILVESPEAWPDGATARARVSGPDRRTTEVTLERVAGNRFAGEISATVAGSYAIGVAVDSPGAASFGASTVAVRAYSAEYAPGAPDPAALERVSALSGGRGAIDTTAAFDTADLPPGSRRVALAGWLLLAAALLWPVAVALSRLALHGRGVAAVRRGGSRLVAAGGRLRGRVTRRDGGTAAPPRPAPRTPKRPPPPPTAPPSVERLLRRKRGEPPVAEAEAPGDAPPGGGP